MVILIGGSSHVGKTMVARSLIRKLGCECISLDHLKEAFLRSQTGSPGNADDVTMRHWMWPFVAEIIKHAIETGRNLIIEGCYIPVEWKESFTPCQMDHIRAVFIVMSETYIRSHFDDIGSFSDVVERRENDVLDMDRLIACSEDFKADCIENGTFYIEINGEYDTDSLMDAVESVIEDPDPLEKGIVL